MCRATSAGGRRCPSHRNPVAQAFTVARQRISRYARACDAAEQNSDPQLDRWQRLFDRALTDLAALDAQHSPAPDLPPPAPTRAPEFTVQSTVHMSDAELAQAFTALSHDPAAQDAIQAVFQWRDEADARRDAELAELAAEAAAEFDSALAPDSPTDPLHNPARRVGRRLTTDQRVREEYEWYVHASYLKAEEACRGSMLNGEGRAKHIDPVTLFSGNPLRAKRYASDELVAWWRENGRLSYSAFRYQVLERDSDRAAAVRARIEDFGHVA